MLAVKDTSRDNHTSEEPSKLHNAGASPWPSYELKNHDFITKLKFARNNDELVMISFNVNLGMGSFCSPLSINNTNTVNTCCKKFFEGIRYIAQLSYLILNVQLTVDQI